MLKRFKKELFFIYIKKKIIKNSAKAKFLIGQTITFIN